MHTWNMHYLRYFFPYSLLLSCACTSEGETVWDNFTCNCSNEVSEQLACKWTSRGWKLRVWVTLSCIARIVVLRKEEEVECVESLPFLLILARESGYSTPEISKRLVITGSAFWSYLKNVWDSRFALLTKVRLFHTYVLTVLRGSKTWTISGKNGSWLDALWYELSLINLQH